MNSGKKIINVTIKAVTWLLFAFVNPRWKENSVFRRARRRIITSVSFAAILAVADTQRRRDAR